MCYERIDELKEENKELKLEMKGAQISHEYAMYLKDLEYQ